MSEAPDPEVVELATKIFDLARRGQTEALVAYVDAGVPANLTNDRGDSLVMLAAYHGHADAVRVLLERGADPNLRNDNGQTPLAGAAFKGFKDVVQTLLAHGADVEGASPDGRTALMIAAGLPAAAPVARLLIERGAKVKDRAPSLFGDVSPLVLSAYNGDEAMFRLLIESGADVESDAVPALAFAMRAQCQACVDMLLPKLPPPALNAAMGVTAPPTGPALATPLFLAKGSDPNARARYDYPILTLAAASDARSVEAMKMLIEHGADVNATLKTPTCKTTVMMIAQVRSGSPLSTGSILISTDPSRVRSSRRRCATAPPSP